MDAIWLDRNKDNRFYKALEECFGEDVAPIIFDDMLYDAVRRITRVIRSRRCTTIIMHDRCCKRIKMISRHMDYSDIPIPSRYIGKVMMIGGKCYCNLCYYNSMFEKDDRINW